MKSPLLQSSVDVLVEQQPRERLPGALTFLPRLTGPCTQSGSVSPLTRAMAILGPPHGSLPHVRLVMSGVPLVAVELVVTVAGVRVRFDSNAVVVMSLLVIV